MATHSRLTGRTSRHHQTQQSETVQYHTAPLPLFCTLTGLNFTTLRRNSFTIPVGHELVAVYDLFDRDDRVRVVVLTADHTAHAFCSGVRDHH